MGLKCPFRLEKRLKNVPEFLFEIRRKHFFVKGRKDFVDCPEPAVVKLAGVGSEWALVACTVSMDQFLFDGRFEDIPFDKDGGEFRHSEFFAYFPAKRLFDSFSVIYMAAHGRIPFAGLDVFGQGPLLQVKRSGRVEYMEVDDRMQVLAAAMTFAAGGFPHCTPLFVDQGKPFFFLRMFHICLFFVVSPSLSGKEAYRVLNCRGRFLPFSFFISALSYFGPASSGFFQLRIISASWRSDKSAP